VFGNTITKKMNQLGPKIEEKYNEYQENVNESLYERATRKVASNIWLKNYLIGHFLYFGGFIPILIFISNFWVGLFLIAALIPVYFPWILSIIVEDRLVKNNPYKTIE